MRFDPHDVAGSEQWAQLFEGMPKVTASHILAAVIARSAGSYAEAGRWCRHDRALFQKKVQELQIAIGVDLVKADHAGVEPRGDDQARQAWRLIDEIYDGLVRLRGLSTGSDPVDPESIPALRLGCFPAHVARFVGKAMTSWRDAGNVPPWVLHRPSESTRGGHGADIQDAFVRQRIEMAILPLRNEYEPSAFTVPLYNWSLVVLAPSRESFGEVGPVDIGQLAAKPVAVSPVGHSTRAAFDDLIRGLRRVPTVVHDGGSFDVSSALCESGFAYLVTASDALDEAQRGRARQLVRRGYGRGGGYMATWQPRFGYRYRQLHEDDVGQRCHTFARDLAEGAGPLRVFPHGQFANSTMFSAEQFSDA